MTDSTVPRGDKPTQPSPDIRDVILSLLFCQAVYMAFVLEKRVQAFVVLILIAVIVELTEGAKMQDTPASDAPERKKERAKMHDNPASDAPAERKQEWNYHTAVGNLSYRPDKPAQSSTDDTKTAILALACICLSVKAYIWGNEVQAYAIFILITVIVELTEGAKMQDTPASETTERKKEGARKMQDTHSSDDAPEPTQEEWDYRVAVGHLSYIQAMAIRPDIMMTVQQCAHFSNDPKREHEELAKRICKYLVRTNDISTSIVIQNTNGETISCGTGTLPQCISNHP